MAGFGVLIVSGILSAIFLFFIAVFAAAAAYIMASYVLEGFSIACMRKKAGDAHTFPAWIPFYSKYLLGRLADRRVMGAVSALLTLLSVCLCVYFYVCRELNTLWFILLLMALLAVFIPGGGRHHPGRRPEGPHVYGPGEAAGRRRKPENRQHH